MIDNKLEIGGTDLAARKANTRMTAEVKVDGHGPYHFVVDSGADTSVLGLSVSRELDLPPTTPVTLHGMTASSLVDRVKVAELDLGESAIRDLKLPVLRNEFLGAQGLIGIDALVDQRLMMDFEKRLIHIEDARIPVKMMDGDIVVVARRQRGQLILTQASTNGRPIAAVIDTGSEITIGNLALRDRLIRGNADKFKTIGVTGVTGVTIDMQVARVAELRLGTIVLRNVPIAFADVRPFALFGLDKEPAMLLGTDFLEKFRRVALDFRARKVRFQLKRCTSTSVSINSSMSMSRISLDGDAGDVCSR